ncbi:hypothetical protein DQ004_15810 [Salmonella enterica subsp. salamae]|nr:hypothetical protein [Salmonella enterica subsp. salamae]
MENAVFVAATQALNVMLDTMKQETGTAHVDDIKAALQFLNEVVDRCDGDLLKGYAVWAEVCNVAWERTSTGRQD